MRHRLLCFSARRAGNDTDVPVGIIQGLGLTRRFRTFSFLNLRAFILIEGGDGVEEPGCHFHGPMIGRARARARETERG